jgi:hypothetical protein
VKRHPTREPWESLYWVLLLALLVVVVVARMVVVKGPKSALSHPRNTIASEQKEHSWGKIRHGLRHRDFGIVAVAVVVEEDEHHVVVRVVVVRVVAVAPVRIVDLDMDVVVGAAAAAVVVVVVVAVAVAPVIEKDVPERYTVLCGNSTIESSHPLPSHMPSIPIEGETTEQ